MKLSPSSSSSFLQRLEKEHQEQQVGQRQHDRSNRRNNQEDRISAIMTQQLPPSSSLSLLSSSFLPAAGADEAAFRHQRPDAHSSFSLSRHDIPTCRFCFNNLDTSSNSRSSRNISDSSDTYNRPFSSSLPLPPPPPPRHSAAAVRHLQNVLDAVEQILAEDENDDEHLLHLPSSSSNFFTTRRAAPRPPASIGGRELDSDTRYSGRVAPGRRGHRNSNNKKENRWGHAQ